MQLIYDSTVYDIGKAASDIKGNFKIISGERISAGGIVFRSSFGVRTGEYTYIFKDMPEDKYNLLFNFWVNYWVYQFQIIDDIGKTKTVIFTDNNFKGDYDYTGKFDINYYKASITVKEVTVNA